MKNYLPLVCCSFPLSEHSRFLNISFLWLQSLSLSLSHVTHWQYCRQVYQSLIMSGVIFSIFTVHVTNMLVLVPSVGFIHFHGHYCMNIRVLVYYIIMCSERVMWSVSNWLLLCLVCWFYCGLLQMGILPFRFSVLRFLFWML